MDDLKVDDDREVLGFWGSSFVNSETPCDLRTVNSEEPRDHVDSEGPRDQGFVNSEEP